MTDLSTHVPSLVLQHLTADVKDYLIQVFERFDGSPTVEQIWQLADEQWVALHCDPLHIDERVSRFYDHPVWLLNGLFVETGGHSITNRQVLADWVVSQQPARIADFGGGFGGLARMIGAALPDSKVEVVDPHPHPAAIALANTAPNLSCVSELTGKYDILIATDVFEHVPDPIAFTAETAEYLQLGGQYLIANYFAPVVLCHLPQLFHFSMSWDAVMRAMGLETGPKVGYGRVYRRQCDLDEPNARKVAECRQRIYSLISRLPRGHVKIDSLLMRLFCKRPG